MSESWRRALGTRRLLASGFGRWGGGVYDLTSGEAVALDDLPSAGLEVGGGRLWRALRAPGEQTAACELLSYDDRGVRTYQRLDSIRDPHDLCWHDGAVHVASSWDGTVWRIGGDGAARPVWQGGDVPDAWHVNSLLVVEGRLHVSAFGRFDGYKAWKLDGPGPAADRARRTAGFVHDIETGKDVLDGLAHPHAPRRVGDRWYVCESTRGALTEIDVDGRVRRRLGIRRFSRGLAVLGRWALVGGNAHRDVDDDRAEVLVVDLRRFHVVGCIPLPCLEVYDVVAVPAELARGVALGFGGNPARAVEQHRGTSRETGLQPAPAEARVQLVTPRTAARLAAAGQPLDPADAVRCVVRGQLPARMLAGDTVLHTVSVVDRAGVPLASVPPDPVRVGARWLPLDPPPDGDAPADGHARADGDPCANGDAPADGHARADGDAPADGHPRTDAGIDAEGHARARADGDPRADGDGLGPPGSDASSAGDDGGGTGTPWLRNPLAPLPHLLTPGEEAGVELLLIAPDRPGRYELRVALHQPQLGWFGTRAQRTVTVEALRSDASRPPASGEERRGCAGSTCRAHRVRALGHPPGPDRPPAPDEGAGGTTAHPRR